MKLTLTSNTDHPVIRVDNFKAGSPVYGSIEFTAEDLRQLNDFAATCPMFGIKCTDCNGLGFYDGIGESCESCRGNGVTK